MWVAPNVGGGEGHAPGSMKEQKPLHGRGEPPTRPPPQHNPCAAARRCPLRLTGPLCPATAFCGPATSMLKSHDKLAPHAATAAPCASRPALPLPAGASRCPTQGYRWGAASWCKGLRPGRQMGACKGGPCSAPSLSSRMPPQAPLPPPTPAPLPPPQAQRRWHLCRQMAQAVRPRRRPVQLALQPAPRQHPGPCTAPPTPPPPPPAGPGRALHRPAHRGAAGKACGAERSASQSAPLGATQHSAGKHLLDTSLQQQPTCSSRSAASSLGSWRCRRRRAAS